MYILCKIDLKISWSLGLGTSLEWYHAQALRIDRALPRGNGRLNLITVNNASPLVLQIPIKLEDIFIYENILRTLLLFSTCLMSQCDIDRTARSYSLTNLAQPSSGGTAACLRRWRRRCARRRWGRWPSDERPLLWRQENPQKGMTADGNLSPL